MGETLALHASERQGTSTYLSEHDRDQPYFALTSKVILMCRFTFFFPFFCKVVVFLCKVKFICEAPTPIYINKACHVCLTRCTQTFSTPNCFPSFREIHKGALQHLLHPWSGHSWACINRGLWLCGWQCFSRLHCGRRASTASISWAEPEQSKYVDAALGLPPFLFALTTKHSVRISAASQHLAPHSSSSQSRSGGCKRSSKPSVWSWTGGYNTYSFAGVVSPCTMCNHPFETHHVISPWCCCSSLRWSTLGLRSPAGMRTLPTFTMSWSTPQPQRHSSTSSTTTLWASLSSSVRETWR